MIQKCTDLKSKKKKIGMHETKYLLVILEKQQPQQNNNKQTKQNEKQSCWMFFKTLKMFYFLIFTVTENVLNSDPKAVVL